MVGWVRLKVQGPAGTTVTLRHAEVLDKDGNFYTENLRAAKATDRYTLKGGGPETFEPHFTFQGFRYVAVDGYPGTLTLESRSRAVVVHSDMAPTGDVRDVEAAGQPAAAQHPCGARRATSSTCRPTARSATSGSAGPATRRSSRARPRSTWTSPGSSRSGSRTSTADQYPTGSVPHVIPDVLGTPNSNAAGGSAGWADVGRDHPVDDVPDATATRGCSSEQYASMTRWVEYERTRAGDDCIWDGDFHFGDWLAFAHDALATIRARRRARI